MGFFLQFNLDSSSYEGAAISLILDDVRAAGVTALLASRTFLSWEAVSTKIGKVDFQAWRKMLSLESLIMKKSS